MIFVLYVKAYHLLRLVKNGRIVPDQLAAQISPMWLDDVYPMISTLVLATCVNKDAQFSLVALFALALLDTTSTETSTWSLLQKHPSKLVKTRMSVKLITVIVSRCLRKVKVESANSDNASFY